MRVVIRMTYDREFHNYEISEFDTGFVVDKGNGFHPERDEAASQAREFCRENKLIIHRWD